MDIAMLLSWQIQMVAQVSESLQCVQGKLNLGLFKPNLLIREYEHDGYLQMLWCQMGTRPSATTILHCQ